MNNKLITFVLFLLCAGSQWSIVFGSEEEAPAAKQSWGEWFINKQSNVAEAAKKRLYQAKEAVKNAPSTWWSGVKKRSGERTPLSEAVTAATLGGFAGATKGGLHAMNTLIGRSLIPDSLFSQNLFKLFGGIEQGGLVVAGAISVAVPYFVLTYGIQKVITYYHNKDIARQVAVDQIKDLISMQLSDSLAYPTSSTKLHALLKNNEFVVDRDDVDGLVKQARHELYKELEDKLTEDQVETDKEINKAISDVRANLMQQGVTSLRNQIDTLYEDSAIKDILNRLQLPEVKAKLSVYYRLLQQRLVEGKAAGTFAATSPVNFYLINEEEAKGIEERKKMTEQQWKLHRESKAAEEQQKKEKESF